MLYSILCYNSEADRAAWTQEQDDALAAKHAIIERELTRQGKLGAVARLMPTTTATTLRSGRQPLVIDGPFAETKEQLLGFYVLDLANLAEAIETARALLAEAGALEIRPIAAFEPGVQVK
jgi:hypothetical protein